MIVKKLIKNCISILLIVFMLTTTTPPVFAETQTQEVTAPIFSLPSNSVDGQLNATIKGRTVVNLLGEDGDCEALSKWNSGGILDSTNKVFGSNSIKNNYDWDCKKNMSDYCEDGKYYFVSGYLKSDGTTDKPRITIDATTTGVQNVWGIADQQWHRVGGKFIYDIGQVKQGLYLVTEGTGEYGYFDGIILTEITADEYNNLFVEQLLEKYPYTNCVTSTDNIRVKSVQEGTTYEPIKGRTVVNLLGDDGDCEDLSKWNDGAVLDNTNKVFGSSSIKNDYSWACKKTMSDYCEDDKYYFISGYLKSEGTTDKPRITIDATTTGVQNVWGIADQQWHRVGGKFIYDIGQVKQGLYLVTEGTGEYGYFDGIMLTEITADEYNNLFVEQLLEKYPYTNDVTSTDNSTTYEPYKESTQYIQLPEGLDGLHSLPNGVYDEINLETGNLTQRIKKIKASNTDFDQYWTSPTNVDTVIVNHLGNIITDNATFSQDNVVVEGMSYINGYYNDVSNIGKYFVDAHNKIYFVVEKGTYTSIAEAQNSFPEQVMTYELEDSQTYKLNIPPLIAYKNGTVYVEPVVKSIGVTDSDGKIVIENTDLPIDDLESVKKIKGSARTSVNEGDFKIDDNRKYIEIIGAGQGEIYEYIYRYDQSLTTIPTIEYTFPIDLDGQIDGNTNMLNKLSEIVDTLQEENKTLKDKMNEIDKGKAIYYDYDDNGSLIKQTNY